MAASAAARLVEKVAQPAVVYVIRAERGEQDITSGSSIAVRRVEKRAFDDGSI